MSDAAIANMVTGLVTITGLVIGFLTIWIRLKYGEKKTDALSRQTSVVEDKLDTNTKITKASGAVAASNARVAATSASDAKSVAESINKKLNGGIDSSLRKVLDEYNEKHDEEIAKLNGKVDELTEYLHDRNHKMLSAMQAQVSKIEAVYLRLKAIDEAKSTDSNI